MLLCIRSYQPGDTSAVVSLWNASTRDWYGWYLWDEPLWRRLVAQSPRFRAERLLLALKGSTPVGWAHWDIVDEPHYERAGVLCALCVHPYHRREGIGRALARAAIDAIRETGAPWIDGFGSWPYSPFYTTLIDGSERSGPTTSNRAAISFLQSLGFTPYRESQVMERDLHTTLPPVPKVLKTCQQLRTPNATWLDTVFRGWELTDHHLLTPERILVSRAIYAPMPGASRQSGKREYALFGVFTPPELRGKGLAGANLAALLSHVRELGGNRVELHVYAENEPAVRLYTKLGFKIIATTLSLRLELPLPPPSPQSTM